MSTYTVDIQDSSGNSIHPETNAAAVKLPNGSTLQTAIDNGEIGGTVGYTASELSGSDTENRDADTLGGYPASTFAKQEDLNPINTSITNLDDITLLVDKTITTNGKTQIDETRTLDESILNFKFLYMDITVYNTTILATRFVPTSLIPIECWCELRGFSVTGIQVYLNYIFHTEMNTDIQIGSSDSVGDVRLRIYGMMRK